MEASKRVVFVSFRGPDDGKPRGRRKRALGVSETASWPEFLGLIKTRLQLQSIKAVYHASSMTPLTSMDELQDIEDLVVEGVEEGAAGVAAGGTTVPALNNAPINSGIGRTGLTPPAAVATSKLDPKRFGADGEDGDDKYKKRSSGLMQAVLVCAPSWAGVVPFSMRGKDEGKKKDDDDLFDFMEQGGRAGDVLNGGKGTGTPTRRREKKHRRSDPRVTVTALALLSCVATMFLLYARLAAKLPQT